MVIPRFGFESKVQAFESKAQAIVKPRPINPFIRGTVRKNAAAVAVWRDARNGMSGEAVQVLQLAASTIWCA
jgi:hypothetical protein